MFTAIIFLSINISKKQMRIYALNYKNGDFEVQSNQSIILVIKELTRN